jgi:hypothetical protein
VTVRRVGTERELLLPGDLVKIAPGSFFWNAGVGPAELACERWTPSYAAGIYFGGEEFGLVVSAEPYAHGNALREVTVLISGTGKIVQLAWLDETPGLERV